MKCTGSEILLPASFFKFQIMRKNKYAYTNHTPKAPFSSSPFRTLDQRRPGRITQTDDKESWRMMTKEIIEKPTLAKIKSPIGRKRVLVYGQKV